MTDSILVLAVAATAVASLSVLLARLIPDEYDRANPRMALARAKARPARR